MNEYHDEPPKEIQEYIDKGKQALKRRNYDYAIELFVHALALKIDLVEARSFLHITKIKKHQENPPSFIIAKTNIVRAQTFVLNAKKLQVTNKFNDAISAYEKALIFDPLNDKIYIKLANLFLNRKMKESALKTFREAVSVNPNSLEALKELGKLCQEKELYQEAEDYFSRALQISPHDADAQKGIKDLAALQTIDKGSWEDQKTFRTKIKDKEEAKKLEKETKEAKTEEDINYLINDLKEKLKEDPENILLLFKLADYCSKIKSFDTAQNTYKQILKLKPDSDIAQKNIDALEMKKIDQQISELEEKLKKEPSNEEIQKRITELKKKKDNVHFERIKEKVAKLPNDSSLRYKYGLALKERGIHTEAIGQFQVSVKEPALRLDSLNMLGLCFKEKNMFDLAVSQFKRAFSLAPEVTKQTKEIIYNLGITYEQMGKATEAANEFKKIYEVDINYKDVAKKIEESYRNKPR